MKNYSLNIVLLLLVAISIVVNFNRIAESKENIEQNNDLTLAPDDSQKEAIHVSMIQLIANPEKYHGRRVIVIGFVHLAFEGDWIYLHREDLTHALVKNGLWLNVPEGVRKGKGKYDDRYNDKYVIVEGIFNSKDFGHMGNWSGAIQNITRFDVWRHGEE